MKTQISKNAVSAKDIQRVMLESYKELKRVCEKHSLKYFACGGTCLGAIKYGGFVPWDDDMDIFMPIEDYEKFIAISAVELPSNLQVFDGTNNTETVVKWGKLHNTNTTFCDSIYARYNPSCNTGIFIDIFPLIPVPKGKLRRGLFLREMSLAFRVMTSRAKLGIGKKYFSNSKLGIIKYIGHVYSYIVPKKLVTGRYNRLAHKYSWTDKTITEIAHPGRVPKGCLYGFGHTMCVMPKEIADNLVSTKFENTTIPISCSYDEYLRARFGDYTAPLPIAKRKQNHVASFTVLDDKTPYLRHSALVRDEKLTYTRDSFLSKIERQK